MAWGGQPIDAFFFSTVQLLTVSSQLKNPVTPLGRIFLRNLAMPFDAYLPAQLEKPVFSRTL